MGLLSFSRRYHSLGCFPQTGFLPVSLDLSEWSDMGKIRGSTYLNCRNARAEDWTSQQEEWS